MIGHEGFAEVVGGGGDCGVYRCGWCSGGGARDRQVLIENLYPQQIHDIPIGEGGDGGDEVGNGADQVAPG